jgi:hypothetical protein
VKGEIFMEGIPNIVRTSIFDVSFYGNGGVKTVSFDYGQLTEVINCDTKLIADKVRYISDCFREKFDTAFFDVKGRMDFHSSHESPNIDGLNMCMTSFLSFRKVMHTIQALCKDNALIFADNKKDPRNLLYKNLADSAAQNAAICKETHDTIKKILTIAYTNYN